jgi:flagellar hook-length control protein FliK
MTSTAIPAQSGPSSAPPERPAGANAPARDDGFARVLDRVSAKRADNAARADDVRKPKDAQASESRAKAAGRTESHTEGRVVKDGKADAPAKAAGDAATTVSGKKSATKARPAQASAQAKVADGPANPAQAATGGQQGVAATNTAAPARTMQAGVADGQDGAIKGGSVQGDGGTDTDTKEADADPASPPAAAQDGPPQPAIAVQPLPILLPVGTTVPAATGDGATESAPPAVTAMVPGVMAGPMAVETGKASHTDAAKTDSGNGDSGGGAKDGSKTAATGGNTNATADPSAVGKAPAAGKLDPATLALLNRAAAGGDPKASDPGGGTVGSGSPSATPGAAVPLGGVASAANGAPAAPATAPGQPPPPPTALAEQVAIQIARHAADGGSSRFEIRLDPAGLGRVDVRLDIHHDGRVQAAIAADRPETMALLNRDARGLERALQNAGLKADSGSLSFSLRQDGGSGGSFFAGSGFGGSGADPGRLTRGGRASDPAAQTDAARPLQAISLLWRRDGVDIRI